ncbi:MAG: protoheme IX farnesyltransferase [Betaproteobacteria bacterium]|nr:protoheme IX farnesyltransferase [Betaproteobacteria bacterium]
MNSRVKLFFDLFKLRIGFAIGLTALAGALAVPGRQAGAWQVALLVACVIAASAAAGAFNQYVERDLDARMGRTRGRAFVTGQLKHGPFWLGVIGLMLALAVCAAAVAVNAVAALFVFLGAFFYGVVYTVILKRRTWMNIVIGGLAGSFAVLAGATAVTPGEIGPVAASLAWVLFLWTPPHFWSLAIAFQDDYRAAGVPMLPVVVGEARAARVVLGGTVVLVASSFLPLLFGLGTLYAAGAIAGGLLFLRGAARLAADPSRTTAMGSFHASLAQLSLLLIGVIADAAWRA